MDVEGVKKKSKKKDNPPLPQNLENIRTRVFINQDAPVHTSTYYHSVFSKLGFDNSFDLDEFKENFKIDLKYFNEEEMEVDMIGIEAPIANAFRRILISEVPTMAIEKVFIIDNSSIIKDEILAHRLGLIPIKADPRDFEYYSGNYTDRNTIVFQLKVECTRNPDARQSDPDEVKYINSRVLSGHLEWIPQGDQETKYMDNPFKPVHNDILIAKLRPGQCIELQCFVHKGIGRDHAKWSPVATATYRLLPEITILEPFEDKEAQKLIDTCPMKVFDIEDLDGVKRAIVANPRNCSMCRECIRSNEWNKKIKLTRVKNHFIFLIESVGMLSPPILFKEAIGVLKNKIEIIRNEINSLKLSE